MGVDDVWCDVWVLMMCGVMCGVMCSVMMMCGEYQSGHEVGRDRDLWG